MTRSMNMTDSFRINDTCGISDSKITINSGNRTEKLMNFNENDP